MENVVFISQPMTGLSAEEVSKIRKEKIKYLEALGYTVSNSFFKEYMDETQENILKLSGINHTDIYYLGKSIMKLSECDTIYFCKGWENSRGCIVEHDVAELYKLTILYED